MRHLSTYAEVVDGQDWDVGTAGVVVKIHEREWRPVEVRNGQYVAPFEMAELARLYKASEIELVACETCGRSNVIEGEKAGCAECGQWRVLMGEQRWHDMIARSDNAEYERGVNDTRRAQEAGPAGSDEREAAYREMEAQWEREGFDG